MRLNLGCGPVLAEGWCNADVAPYETWPASYAIAVYGEVDLSSQVVQLQEGDRLPWPDDSVEGAVAHHVLQMVAWPDLVPWLTEVRRVLQPGAYLRLSVPDLALAYQWLEHGDGIRPLPPIADEHEPSIDGKVCLWLSQAGATRSVFTGPWLVELCERAGFTCAMEAGWQGWGLSDGGRHFGTGPAWLYDLDLTPDRRDESAYVDAIA